MKLTEMDLKLDTGGIPDFSYQKASVMQGVLMEWLDPEYAAALHRNRWNPYAQYLEYRDNAWHWMIKTFEEEADQRIGGAVLNPEKTQIELRHSAVKIPIVDKQVSSVDSDQLLNQYYFQDAPKTIRVYFKTPTAFKRQGEYLFYPDIRCVYQSMILKYDAVTVKSGEAETAVLEELVKNTRILQYRLRSCSFHLEGVRIPSFMGEILLGLRGSQTLINYVHFLFRFACYSGAGIKTAMGMGAVGIRERRRNGVTE